MKDIAKDSRLKVIGKVVVSFVGMLLVAVMPFPAVNSGAESPVPTYYSGDIAPGGSFPTYSGQPHNANAIVIEGLGTLGCNYSSSSIENATVQWVNNGYQTITEITPQTVCGNLTQYENLISSMLTYVEAHTSNPGRYWGGFMLDEEPGYGFTAAQLISLSTYTSSLMAGTPGMTYWFNEDQPNAFTTSQYNSLVGAGGYEDPQVYTFSEQGAVNGECSTYGLCINILTECATCSSPGNLQFDSWTYAIDTTGGYSDMISTWGSGYWFNWFQYP